MLSSLQIRNLALARQVDLAFSDGLTTITGESGAGKSMLLDALLLACGHRGRGRVVRNGSDRAEISAEFVLDELPAAQDWLQQHDLEDGEDCILRRLITADGRSRSSINGRPVTLRQLKSFSERLISIHGQHEHQSLLRKDAAIKLIDLCGQLKEDRAACQTAWRVWQDALAESRAIDLARASLEDRRHYLDYQISELEQLAPVIAEPEQLETEQKNLASAEETLGGLNQALNLLEADSDGVLSRMSDTIRAVQRCGGLPGGLAEIQTMLAEARINLEEVSHDIQRQIDSIEQNPDRLQQVDQRLAEYHALARKHRCESDALVDILNGLLEERATLERKLDDPEALRQQCMTLHADFEARCQTLTSRRTQTAKSLEGEIRKQLERLGMSRLFCISVQAGAASANGADEIELLYSSTDKAQLSPLRETASGGELSRISLCIQMVAASRRQTPTLVFDEVDVGIGGATAEVVGKLLRELGTQTQTLCITHQPQVAALGHTHIHVTRSTVQQDATCSAKILGEQERVSEVARMLGGVQLSGRGMALASELLGSATVQ